LERAICFNATSGGTGSGIRSKLSEELFFTPEEPWDLLVAGLTGDQAAFALECRDGFFLASRFKCANHSGLPVSPQ
jgi:hypothetical protein